MSEFLSSASVQAACLRSHRLAAMSVLSQARLHEGLISLRRVLFVVMYDEDAGWSPQRTRLAGYGARRVPWGVRCGGAQDCRFDKNANLRPKPRAVGWRMDSRHRAVLRSTRQLRKAIASRRDESDGAISTQIQLPEFWAAFGPCDVDRIDGDGPELLGEVHTTGQSAEELLRERRRDRQREELEQERRNIAARRHRDPVIARAIGAVGLTLACLLPLLLAAYVIRAVNQNGDDNAALSEL